MLEVSEKEEGLVELHLPNGTLKIRSLEPVPICEPVPISPLVDDLATAPSGPVGRQSGLFI